MSTRIKLLAVTALAFLGLAAAAPAAAGPVAPDAAAFLNCESINAKILCDVGITGAVGTVTIDWTINGTPRPLLRNQSSIMVSCTVGNIVGVRVTVTDSCEVTTRSTSELCRIVGQ